MALESLPSRPLRRATPATAANREWRRASAELARNAVEIQQNDAGNRQKDQRNRFQASEYRDGGNPGRQRRTEKGQATDTCQFKPGIVFVYCIEGFFRGHQRA